MNITRMILFIMIRIINRLNRRKIRDHKNFKTYLDIKFNYKSRSKKNKGH